MAIPAQTTAQLPIPTDAERVAPVVAPFKPRRTFRTAWLAEHGDFGEPPGGTDPRTIPLIRDAP